MAEPTKPPETTKPTRQWTMGMKEDGLAFKPRTFQEMLDFATMVCKTDFVPTDFRNNPGAVIAAWQTGYEIGLPPMASIKYIAVINGRTRIWGNAYWALIKSHPLCEYTKELPEHEAFEKGYGECTVKRKGSDEPVTARFTKEMAERSGVWGGKGATEDKRKMSVWYLRPGRMLQWMARNLAGNDAIPEATLGVEIAELAFDEPKDITPQPEIKRPMPLEVRTDEATGLPVEDGSLPLEVKTDETTGVHSEASTTPTTPEPTAQPDGENSGSPRQDQGNENHSRVEPGASRDSKVGTQASEADSSRKQTTPNKTPATLQARVEWCKTAPLEEISKSVNYATENMGKQFSQGEQAAICRALDARKAALTTPAEPAKE